jgi:hypothetical protein
MSNKEIKGIESFHFTDQNITTIVSFESFHFNEISILQLPTYLLKIFSSLLWYDSQKQETYASLFWAELG